MEYGKIKKAKFINRPNRFIANVKLNGEKEMVHVKNTGRCKEIFVEGATVILEEGTNPNRKTKYSIIGGYKGNRLINMDSQVPNGVVYEAILANRIEEIQNVERLKKEVTFNKSRFDLYYENKYEKGFIEVKGVTLEHKGISMFPDAPTKRGTKHIYELIEAKEQGYKSYVFFLVQMGGIKQFTPNYEMDPEFGEALKQATKRGVRILVYDSLVEENEILIGKKLEYFL